MISLSRVERMRKREGKGSSNDQIEEGIISI